MGRVEGWFVVCCLVAALSPVLFGSMGSEAAGADDLFPGWPAALEGVPLVPREMSEREAAFARGFPGRVGVFENGGRLVIVRWVTRATRKLHSSADCLRALGYGIEPQPLYEAGGERWGRSTARRDGSAWDVRERYFEDAGRAGAWSDVSAWYWGAAMGSSEGPWWAVTIFE
jgi:hypothetical protein